MMGRAAGSREPDRSIHPVGAAEGSSGCSAGDRSSLTPVVSIGLPVYNGEALLEKAIVSLLGQTFRAFEIVISDNASFDHTEEICRTFARRDSRIRYHRNAENEGIWSNFRRVLDLARGRYFMWASDDDMWSEGFVESLVNVLDESPAVVLATPRTVYLGGDRRLMSGCPPAGSRSPTADLDLLLSYRGPVASWIYGLYRRDWLRYHAEELFHYHPWGGDVVWLTRVCLCHPVGGSNEAVLYKRESMVDPGAGRARLAPSRGEWLALTMADTLRIGWIGVRYGRGLRGRILMLSLHIRGSLRFYLRKVFRRIALARERVSSVRSTRRFTGTRV